MATKKWKGDALPVAQVTAYVFAGTWEATDIVTITIGSKTVSVVAGSTTITTLIDTVVTAFNALDATLYPEFSTITASRSSTSLVLTADDEGVPFAATVATTETGGGAADAQTIDGGASSTGTDSTACSGPNHWDTAANWSPSGVPISNDDVILENSAADILYGLAQSAVTLTSLTIAASYTGKIGLPLRNEALLYYEYRATYLAISATTVRIGEGAGQGSGRIKLDLGSVVGTVFVFNTATPAEDGLKAVMLKGTHANNVLNVTRGSVGVAMLASETATIETLRIGYVQNIGGDADVFLGTGCTLTTINQSGGQLTVNSNFTTLTKTDGTTDVLRAATATTLDLDGGVTYWQSSGTVTTANVGNGATLDFTRDMRGRTVSACNIASGATILDPFKTVTWTAGVDLERAAINDVTLDLGTHIRLTRGSVA